MRKRCLIACVAISVLTCAPSIVSAQALQRAVVVRILSLTVTNTTTPETFDEVASARIVSGPMLGQLIPVETDYVQGGGNGLAVGDDVYVATTTDPTTGNLTYTSIDHYRLPAVIFFLSLFIVCILYFGRKQGGRGLISLGIGVGLIVFVFLPGVIHGYSPILLSVVAASFVATIGAYITHGFSKMTTAAILGMIVTIVSAALMADVAVHVAHLSGVTDEVTSNLFQYPHNGVEIDFQGLLLGGIIIGFLGVLYDAAIGQAVAVEELARAAPNHSRRVVFERATRMGREHIGALVNTLVLAYVGASLPLMITLYEYLDSYGTPILNIEFIATEVIRTAVGSTGLILTIPITTAVAVWMLVGEK